MASKVARRTAAPRNRSNAPDGALTATEVAVVGGREPCPCGSGRRYKACHGRAAARAAETLVHRPFAGLAGEGDWVALREIVPAATAVVTLTGPARGETDDAPTTATVATVLPQAWPALRRVDGSVFVGLQVAGGSGDVSRDAAAALLRAVAAEPGTPLPPDGLSGPGPRLQDVVADEPLNVTVHQGFDFWIEGAGDTTTEVASAMERANASVVPTARLTSVDAAYWCRMRERSHLRWVLTEDEEPALDAMARLHAAGADGLGEGTRFVGSFRAHGLVVPVWDLPLAMTAEAVEEPAAAYAERLGDALATDAPLRDDERRARSGLLSRQLTLR